MQLLGITKRISNAGAHLVSLTENIDTDTPAGRLMLTILAALAGLELETTRERTAGGRLQAAQQGIMPVAGRGLPMGYRRGQDGRVLLDDPMADAVRAVFSAAQNATPYAVVAARLDAQGIPTQRGGGWTASQVRFIITTEAYYQGVLQFGRHRHADDPTR
ncbi:recombinase family protein [Deinococcus maricopensis]|uniref:recombinase family protein n=1 Tax=Deinococcus maricopensis TaxID=309887 RepID=UPI00030D063F|nr:recombinase family protein [Deinococcus maricopensis]